MIKGDDAMIKGADISSLLDVEECGGRFYDESPAASYQAPGKAFPLGGRCPRRGRMRGRRSSRNASPSSVACGDSFPLQGEAC